MAKLVHALVLGATLSASVPTQAADKTPITLKPSSRWVAEFKDDHCAIRRNYAGEGQQITVEFDNYTLGEEFEVGIIGVTLKPRSETITTRFEPDPDLFRKRSAVTLSSADGGSGVAFPATVYRMAQLDEDAKQREKKKPSILTKELRNQRESEITGLLVKGAFERNLLFETGPLTKPFAVVRQCIDKVIAAKGLDPAALATLSRRAIPKPPVNWVTDFPDKFKYNVGAFGQSRVRLLIDETGKAIDCYIQSRGEDADFDKHTCDKALANAVFEPALDAEGKPTKSFWSTKVIYGGAFEPERSDRSIFLGP